MASRRAQDRVTAAKVCERLARRRQVEEAVLLEAAAALESVQAAERALVAAQDRRSRALGTVAWLLPETEAAAVLGVAGQALRVAKRGLTGARAQELGAQLAGAVSADAVPAGSSTTGTKAPAPLIHQQRQSTPAATVRWPRSNSPRAGRAPMPNDKAAITAPRWSHVVDAYVRALTAAPTPRAASVAAVAEAVETAVAALTEAERRNPDPFGWPAEATTWCLAAAACYQEAAGWTVLQLPLPADCHLEDTELPELTAGAARLLDVARDATLACRTDTPRAEAQLADAAAALSRALLSRPS